MPVTQQNAVIEKVAHQQALHPRDRLAAILMIVFAQRAEDIAASPGTKSRSAPTQ